MMVKLVRPFCIGQTGEFFESERPAEIPEKYREILPSDAEVLTDEEEQEVILQTAKGPVAMTMRELGAMTAKAMLGEQPKNAE